MSISNRKFISFYKVRVFEEDVLPWTVLKRVSLDESKNVAAIKSFSTVLAESSDIVDLLLASTDYAVDTISETLETDIATFITAAITAKEEDLTAKVIVKFGIGIDRKTNKVMLICFSKANKLETNTLIEVGDLAS